MGLSAREEVFSRLDPNGMIARSVPGIAGEEGNQWTHTATAILDLYLRKEITREEIAKLFDPLYRALRVPGKSGLINKKFTGVGVVSSDEVTFDDIIGFVLLAKLSNRLGVLVDLVDLGEKTGWVLTNTGKTYFTAIIRPWHIAAFKLSAHPSRTPSIWEKSLLAAYFVYRGFSRGAASGIRLDRLMAAAVAGESGIVDLSILAWRKLVLKDYGTFSRVLVAYYNDENNFIARSFPE